MLDCRGRACARACERGGSSRPRRLKRSPPLASPTASTSSARRHAAAVSDAGRGARGCSARAVGAEHAPYVHLGATSQDVLDTAAMLIAKRALAPLLADLSRAADAAGRLPIRTGTPDGGADPASPSAADQLRVARCGLAVGIEGPSRRLASSARRASRCRWAVPLAARPPAIAALVATSWRSPSRPPVAHGPVPPPGSRRPLGDLGGHPGKIARDATLLAQQEVGEAREHAERAVAARPRWCTSTIPSRRCRCSPAPSACPGSSRRRFPRWCRSTSALRARGRRSGGPSELLVLVGPAAAWRVRCWRVSRSTRSECKRTSIVWRPPAPQRRRLPRIS